VSSDATIPAPPPSPASAGRISLLVMTDDRVDAVLLPARGAVTIGRDAEADVRIDHHSVSRIHARLTVDGLITIEDLGSSNGTHVAGMRATANERVPLRFGEVFHLGLVAIVVQQMVAAADESPAVVAGAAPRPDQVMLAQVAAGDIAVLFVGETGAGKEVSVRALHQLSPRRAHPLLTLNCGALAEGLLESELFGHERGAFSGAVAAKPGLLETARGGTVFLDEIGDLPMGLQVKLLRVLEEGAVRAVGGLKSKPIDVRFVAATNRDLETAIEAGTFRADLYYRLAGVTIEIPPLRARTGEIAPLAHALVVAACKRLGRSPLAISQGALDVLVAYPWPGNVRELKNAVERAVLLTAGATIEATALPAKIVATPAASPSTTVAPATGWWQPDAAAQEKKRILDALAAAGGHQAKAAELLGMSRRTLINRLDELSIPRPRKGKS
jgi:transcriptional regulator with PAS, ATPase and Fis domain